MFKQAFMLLLLWPLLGGTAAGEESAAGNRFHLKGVLVSDSGRSALVNRRPSRVGDRVAGAEIVAIDEGAVRIRIGQDELVVRVGAAVDVDRVFAATSNEPRRALPPPAAAKDSALASARPPHPSRSRTTALPEHTVAAGETLSGIAHRYLTEGATLNQMMVALYEANPQAFSNNINVLYAGATLRIPADESLHRQGPEAATAAVLRHRHSWQSDQKLKPKLASAADGAYGPVRRGETLSGIAQGLVHDSVSMNQMMIALFDANPQAFGGNINLLHAGATLQIPGSDALHRQLPATATAEVIRQTKLWRERFGQKTQSTIAHTRIKPAAGRPTARTPLAIKLG